MLRQRFKLFLTGRLIHCRSVVVDAGLQFTALLWLAGHIQVRYLRVASLFIHVLVLSWCARVASYLWRWHLQTVPPVPLLVVALNLLLSFVWWTNIFAIQLFLLHWFSAKGWTIESFSRTLGDWHQRVSMLVIRIVMLIAIACWGKVRRLWREILTAGTDASHLTDLVAKTDDFVSNLDATDGNYHVISMIV